MRIILHCVLILAFAFLLKHLSSVPNSLLNYFSSLPEPKARAPPAPLLPSPEDESYILVAQWPPGVCSGSPSGNCMIKPVPNEFKIHGLWPEPKGAPSTETFNDISKIASLSTEMDKNWPNLKSNQQSVIINFDFWKHEWTDHGNYSGFGVHEYFEKTLKLFKDVGEPLRSKLVANGTRPTNMHTYSLTLIEAALKQINGGFSCRVVCNTRNFSRKKQIKEIWFYYYKNFTKRNALKSALNCSDQILFPAPGFGLTEVVSMTEVHHHPL